MHIPFGDLARQYQTIKPDIDQAVKCVLKSGWFILGKEVARFENNFAKLVKAKHAVGVANGLEGLQIALLATGVNKGDEVITTPLSAFATALSITAVGAKPIFVDINPRTYNLDYHKIETAITKKTKVILPVHLYGLPAEMEGILKIAKRYKLKVVEDAAQAHGAKYNGQPVGPLGDIGVFSFYPSKNLGAYGDAGCIVTNSTALAARSKALRDYGQRARYDHKYAGLNSRLDELQAAILSAKLPYLQQWNKRRRHIAKMYQRSFSDLPLVLPQEGVAEQSCWHLFVIQTKKRGQLKLFLQKNGIDTQIHYPKVMYMQKGLPGYKNGLCPEAERLVGKILSLPIYPELSDNQVFYIVKTIKQFYSRYG